MAAEPRVAVACIMRPKGIKGEVRARVMTHSADRFDSLSEVVIQRQGDADLTTRLERWRPERNDVLLKFAGIDSPEHAKARLSGGYVTVGADEVLPLPPEAYYVFDLVGCAVVDESGRHLGKLVDVLEMPSTDVYQIQGDQGEILVPAVGDFVVDVRLFERRIIVRGVADLLPQE